MTIFYIDRSFSAEEKQRIEKNLAKKDCLAAIYDCSYYLFIHKKVPKGSFRADILHELRKILTGNPHFNLMKRLGKRSTKIMSSAEFYKLSIEIYDLELYFDSHICDFKILAHYASDKQKMNLLLLDFIL